MSRSSQILPLCSLGCCLATLLLAPAGVPAEDVDGCTELTLNTTLRREGGQAPRTRDCYRPPGLARGILTLDVSAPDAPGTEPLLVFQGESSAQGPFGHRIVWQTPRGLIVEVEDPGSFLLEVAAEDPGEPLAGYKLRTAFVNADSAAVEVVTFAADPPDSCAERAAPLTPEPVGGSKSWLVLADVDEEDCDVMELATATPGVVSLETADLPLLAALYAEGECAAPLAEGLLEEAVSSIALPVHPATYRLDVASATGNPGSYQLGVRFFAPCAQGELDDHGDTPLCATPVELGGSAAGELGNGMGDDEDFFTFVLEAQRTVEIELGEGFAGHLTLYDNAAQRLEAGCCGEAGRIVRTLGPGRYYVRVGGVGKAYALRVGSVGESSY